METRDFAELSSCIGKVAFSSWHMARAALERGRKGMHNIRRGIYKCNVCGKWHAGQRSRRARKKDEPEVFDDDQE